MPTAAPLVSVLTRPCLVRGLQSCQGGRPFKRLGQHNRRHAVGIGQRRRGAGAQQDIEQIGAIPLDGDIDRRGAATEGGLAPRASSRRTILGWSVRTASTRAVRPPVLRPLGSAPSSSSARTFASDPAVTSETSLAVRTSLSVSRSPQGRFRRRERSPAEGALLLAKRGVGCGIGPNNTPPTPNRPSSAAAGSGKGASAAGLIAVEGTGIARTSSE